MCCAGLDTCGTRSALSGEYESVCMRIKPFVQGFLYLCYTRTWVCAWLCMCFCVSNELWWQNACHLCSREISHSCSCLRLASFLNKDPGQSSQTSNKSVACIPQYFTLDLIKVHLKLFSALSLGRLVLEPSNLAVPISAVYSCYLWRTWGLFNNFSFEAMIVSSLLGIHALWFDTDILQASRWFGHWLENESFSISCSPGKKPKDQIQNDVADWN